VPFPVIILGAGIVGYIGGRTGHPGFQIAGGHGAGQGATVADADSMLGEELPAHAKPTLAQSMRQATVWLLLWLLPVVALIVLAGWNDVFTKIATFFSTMAVVTFGGAYAVLAYVAQQAVENYGWLSAREMLDGLGMAETTPGPLIMVLQFVGFMGAYRNPGDLSPLLAGTLGGLLATWVTFIPCFLWIFLGAPFIERMRSNAALSAAMSAITAAVVGVILNLAIWFAVHTIFRVITPIRVGPLGFDMPVLVSADPWAFLLTAASILAVFRFKIGMFTVLAVASLAGVALHYFG
jgi:chromate transporter